MVRSDRPANRQLGEETRKGGRLKTCPTTNNDAPIPSAEASVAALGFAGCDVLRDDVPRWAHSGRRVARPPKPAFGLGKATASRTTIGRRLGAKKVEADVHSHGRVARRASGGAASSRQTTGRRSREVDVSFRRTTLRPLGLRRDAQPEVERKRPIAVGQVSNLPGLFERMMECAKGRRT